jgi:stress response protein YsnF
MSERKRPSEREARVPLVEERLEVKKRTVTTGKVRVVTHTETVEEVARAVLNGEERTSKPSNWINRSLALSRKLGRKAT